MSIKGTAHPLFQFCPFTIQPNGIGGCWRLGSTHSLYSLLTPFLEFHTVEVCCWFNTKKNQQKKQNMFHYCGSPICQQHVQKTCLLGSSHIHVDLIVIASLFTLG